MKQFLKVSIVILLAQIFLQDASFAMDMEERSYNQEITFSVHQKIFHAKLEKLKNKITKFPSIFISYSRRDKDQKPLIDAIAQDLIDFGFDVEANRPGGESHSHIYTDRIKTADKVLLIGSPFLKQDYDNEIGGEDPSEINNIRTRANSSDGLKGIIPLWFNGEFKDNFPWGISHFPARYLENKSILDTNYFTHFFELLMDIFHTEEGGEEILEVLRKKKESFKSLCQLSPKTLKQYEEQYLKEKQEEAERKQKKQERILGLVEEGSVISSENKMNHSSGENESKTSLHQKNEHFITIENSFDILVKKWGERVKTVVRGYLPEVDKSFIETTSEGCGESYLVQLGNKLHQSRNHQGTKLLITGHRQKIAVTGMGGIGKTSLALAYAHFADTHKLYEVIHWIKAEDTSLYHQSYISLLKVLKEPFETLAGIEDSTLVLGNVLQDKKYLLIYDNVESPGDLQDILPQGNKGHIIITSRHDSSGWDETLEMDVFSAKQAVDYIFERVNHLERTSEKEALAQKIAKKLGYLPLALSQMTSYVNNIKNKLNNPQEGLQDYITKLKAGAKTIFSYEDPKKKTKGKEKTKRDLASIVYTTWDITLNELEPLARQRMAYFSYLGSDDIPIDLFRGSSLDCNDEEIEEALDELKRYSMIKRSGGYVSLHRLVQKVGRLQQVENQQESSTIETLVKLFVDKAETLFKLDLDKPDKQDHFFRYGLQVLKLHQYTKNIINRDEELLEKFEWEDIMITLIGGITIIQYQEKKEEIRSTQKNLIEIIEKQEHLFQEFQNRTESKAFKWLCDIAKKSHYLVQACIGTMYEYGVLIQLNKEKAFKWFKRIAKQGNVRSQYKIGEMYKTGIGIDKDDTEAVRWYQQAAEQGLAEAQCALGTMYMSGKGVNQDYTEAVKWYRLAAKQGHANAQYCFGVMYYYGNGVVKNKTKALKWYRYAAEQGFAVAQFRLGEMYKTGIGIDKDDTEAVRWYQKAAEQGFAEAQHKLGLMYYYGRGVGKDAAEALKWFGLSGGKNYAAIEKSYNNIQFSFVEVYKAGRGELLKDNAEGVEWDKLTAQPGSDLAKEKLEKLEGLEKSKEGNE